MEKKTIINTKAISYFVSIKELIQYKDLFYVLSAREFKVRYAQTFLGFLWAFIQPLLMLIIFTFIFGYAIKVDTGNVPYPVFVLTGMIAWNYFSLVVNLASRSIINEQNMVKKIYFPRIIIPLSKAGVGLIDFLITLLLLFGVMFYYGITPGINIIWLPFFIILIIISSLAIGIWISALTIRYRDFQHIVPFILQVGMYVTPIAYSASYVPEKYLLMYYILNPIAGVV